MTATGCCMINVAAQIHFIRKGMEQMQESSWEIIKKNKSLFGFILLSFTYAVGGTFLIAAIQSPVILWPFIGGELLLFLGLGFMASSSLAKPVHRFKKLAEEISSMSRAQDAGDIDARINTDQLDSEYRDLAEAINKMVEGHITVNRKAMAVVAQFGKGSFDTPLEKFPGKKAFINDSIEALRSDLKNINAEIHRLISSFKEGKLSVRADADQFSGDWVPLISGLNGLLDITLDPIREAESVLEKLKNGDLSTHVAGQYKGDHAQIKNTLNQTISTLSEQIREISQILTEMSAGNLDVSINGDYNGDFLPLKTSLNKIIQSFNSLLQNIENSADQVASGAKQVSDSAQALASGATEQASSVEELTASIEEISSQITSNAEHAKSADDLVQTARQDALNGNDQMMKMLKSMDEINESSSNISKIIKVIDEIAFQTNILALNAAVEAARAGQHGKGFAVVAEEVRNLAARSAAAAKETTALIEGSIKKVENGTQIANDTAAELNKIVEAVTKVTKYIDNIATASREQATGIEQINQGISQVSQVVQTNSATSQESAAASEELSSHADLLRNMVRKFKLKSDGTAVSAEKLNPEVLRMIDQLGEKKKEKIAVGAAAGSANISDRDFGKY